MIEKCVFQYISERKAAQPSPAFNPPLYSPPRTS